MPLGAASESDGLVMMKGGYQNVAYAVYVSCVDFICSSHVQERMLQASDAIVGGAACPGREVLLDHVKADRERACSALVLKQELLKTMMSEVEQMRENDPDVFDSKLLLIRSILLGSSPTTVAYVVNNSGLLPGATPSQIGQIAIIATKLMHAQGKNRCFLCYAMLCMYAAFADFHLLKQESRVVLMWLPLLSETSPLL